jgi:hypothetical protein
MDAITSTLLSAIAQPTTGGVRQEWVAFKDILLLVAGGVFGLFLAVFVQPLIEDDVRGLLIRIVGHLRIRSKSSLAGDWNAVWAIDGKPLDLSAEMKNIRLHEVGNRIAGEFKWHGRTYRLLGNRITSNFVSGTYEDVIAGYTLHGAFQLQVFPKEQFMVGRWMGFNRDNDIVEGPWQWRRTVAGKNGVFTTDSASKYPFETDSSLPKTRDSAINRASSKD